MLSEKPWKSEAVLRLCLTLFLCQFLGALSLAALRYYSNPTEANPWLVGGLTAGSAACTALGLFLIRQPWGLDRLLRRFLLLLLFVYLGLTLGLFVQHVAGKPQQGHLALRISIGALCFQGMLLGLLPTFLREHSESLSRGFGLRERPIFALVMGLSLACVFLPVGELLQMISAKIMERLDWQAALQPAVEALKSSSAWVDRVAMAIVAVVLAPLAEEILFRGIIYPTLKRAGFRQLAFWGTSLLFALIHQNIATFVPLFSLALVLTVLYERTGNLLAPLSAHAMFNLLNFVKFMLIEHGII